MNPDSEFRFVAS